MSNVPLGEPKNLFRTIRRSRPAQWIAIVLASIVLAHAIRTARLPAHQLIGGMGAGVLGALLGATVRLPLGAMFFSLSVVCAMIARVMTPSVLGDIAANWPIFVFMVILVVLLGSVMGWLLARAGVFPGSTAIWGTSPGAPTVMVMLSERYGADPRLVAFLQYSRVMVVAVVSSVVARLFGETPGGAGGGGDAPLVAVDWTGLAQTVALCLVATAVCLRLKNPLWAVVLPMFGGTFLHHGGVIAIELPWWLQSLAFGAVGLGIGLRFTREIVLHALRSLPKVLGTVFVMIAVCSGFGLFFYGLIGIDPLSAYLAASPAGMDCIAIIASTLKVNMSFIMAVHVSRLFVVITLGPAIAVFIAGRLERREQAGME